MQEGLDKAALRRMLLAQRQEISPEVRAGLDERIACHVWNWWCASRVRSIGAYWPMRGEPDLRALYARLHADGVQLGLPMVVGKDAALAFAAWQPGDELLRDAFGCAVPGAQAAPLQPEALLIPCVGFNARNQRLGYGGGFYDRTLAQTPRPAAIGIAYAAGACDFAGDEHDIALDRVITEAG